MTRLVNGLNAERVIFRENCSVDDSARIKRDTDTPLARTINAWMRYADLSVTDIHKRTGLSRATITYIGEAGKEPDVSTLKRIAAELGTTAGALIDAIPPPSAPTPPKLLDRLELLEAARAANLIVSQRVAKHDAALQLLLESEELPKTVRDRMREVLAPSQEGLS
jgi:transcriptional regulator with XRE-family HTH domain